MAKFVTISGGIPRMQSVTIDIKDEGSALMAASVLNFTGSGVAATDAGSGQANIAITGGGSLVIYDEVITVSGTITAGSNVTLPNSGTYETTDLEVYKNGQFLEPGGVDYSYVGAGPTRTQVQFAEDLVDGDKIRFRIEGVPLNIYDETIDVNSTIVTGTNITLPNSGEYAGDELEVFLNGNFMEHAIDYNYVGMTSPKTQIQMTFDLYNGDKLRFRIDQT